MIGTLLSTSRSHLQLSLPRLLTRVPPAWSFSISKAMREAFRYALTTKVGSQRTGENCQLLTREPVQATTGGNIWRRRPPFV